MLIIRLNREAESEQLSPLDLEILNLGQVIGPRSPFQQCRTTGFFNVSSIKRLRLSANSVLPNLDHFRPPEIDTAEQGQESPAPQKRRRRNQKTYQVKAHDTAVQGPLRVDTNDSMRERQPRRLPIDELELVPERLSNDLLHENERECSISEMINH